ncbi:MAG: HU family DNA-binding protein [Clostridia bacterium]|nr:HU family DNA-binding protein [Clostridia bacterium]
MNKTELVAALAAKAEISKKDADKALAAFVEIVTEELKKGEKIQLIGFGTFETRERPARTGINPRTKQEIKIAACKAPAFKAGAALKNAVK